MKQDWHTLLTDATVECVAQVKPRVPEFLELAGLPKSFDFSQYDVPDWVKQRPDWIFVQSKETLEHIIEDVNLMIDSTDWEFVINQGHHVKEFEQMMKAELENAEYWAEKDFGFIEANLHSYFDSEKGEQVLDWRLSIPESTRRQWVEATKQAAREMMQSYKACLNETLASEFGQLKSQRAMR